jgi:surfeit locus 1 family protein
MAFPASQPPITTRRGGLFWGFIALMLALMVLFTALGVWQLERLGEKERLIASVEQRMHLAPASLPPVAEWSALDPDAWEYRPVIVSGLYRPADTVLVFTSLADQRGQYGGPGYWVMTPLDLATGGTIYINRGFVPETSASAFTNGGPAEPGLISLTGLARAPEAIGSFTPAPDPAKRVDWVRDPVRIARMSSVAEATIAPLTIDLPAGPTGALPQGGETVLSFPNNHLGYAITWFGFAVLVPFMLFFWARRQLAPPPAKP